MVFHVYKRMGPGYSKDHRDWNDYICAHCLRVASTGTIVVSNCLKSIRAGVSCVCCLRVVSIWAIWGVRVLT